MSGSKIENFLDHPHPVHTRIARLARSAMLLAVMFVLTPALPIGFSLGQGHKIKTVRALLGGTTRHIRIRRPAHFTAA